MTGIAKLSRIKLEATKPVYYDTLLGNENGGGSKARLCLAYST